MTGNGWKWKKMVVAVITAALLALCASSAFAYGGGGGSGGLFNINPGGDVVDPMTNLLTPPEFDDEFKPFEFTYDPIQTESVGPTDPTIPDLTRDELLRIVIISGYAGKVALRLVTGEGVFNVVMLASDVRNLMKHTGALLSGEGLGD